MSKTVWEKLNDSQKDELMQFNKEYIDFLSVSKTERAFVNNSIALVEKAGFKNLSEVTELKPGDKVYSTNKGKNILAFIIGKEPIRNGLNLLGAHIDSPRTDLKQHPLYESNGLVLLDTPYGMKVNMDIIHTLKDNGNLMDGCIIVVEDLTEEKLEYEAPFKLIKENNYGITCLQIVKYEEAAM